MKLTPHTPREFADAMLALLPPGKAWQWPAGGFGDTMLLGLGQEPSRLEEGAQQVLDSAIEQHRRAYSSWTIEDYRSVAKAAIDGVTETLPRRPAAVGSKVGDRLWSSREDRNFDVPLLQVDHLLGPARVGSKVGGALWSTRGRYIIRVRYYSSVVDPAVVWEALSAFQQSHVFLWFEDISGRGGFYAPN